MIDVEIIKTVTTAINNALSADRNCTSAFNTADADDTDSISPTLFAIPIVNDHRTDRMMIGIKLTNSAMITNTPAPERRIPTLFWIAPYASEIEDPISGIKELRPNRAALFATLSAAPDNTPFNPITAVNMLIAKVIPYLKPLLISSINPPIWTRAEILELTDNDRKMFNSGANTVVESRDNS